MPALEQLIHHVMPQLSANARKVTDTYSEEAVMARWLNLFTSLTEK